MKKTSLVILTALAFALISGASAYAFTEGVFDDVFDLIGQDEEVVEGTIQEEPTIIESELTALISLNTEKDDLIMITGSLYLAGELLNLN